MTPAGAHHGAGAGDLALTAAVLTAAVAYLAAAARLRRRGDAWPVRRDLAFATGAAVVAYALTASLPGEPFTAHVVRHLLVAMAGPLLLVLARPLTMLLRTLPPGPARRGLLTVAHSPAAAWFLCPPVAALLDVGGLWMLHRTPLAAAAHERPLLAAALQTHVLLAGLLYTSAVCQLDPVRRRWSLPWRGATLLLAGSAHAVLAKSLYADPPPGLAVAPHDLRTGAQTMYYGGDLVDIALAVVLAMQWYRVAGRQRPARRGGGRRTAQAPRVARVSALMLGKRGKSDAES